MINFPRSLLLLAIFPLLIVAPFAASLAHEGDHAHPTFTDSYLPGAALFAVILACCHLFAPSIRRVLEEREAFVASFGGGMAIGYVFVHLFPELETGHALLGRMIFLVGLAGFVAYYSFETLIYVRQRRKPGRAALPIDFSLKLAVLCVYNWLIVYGLPEAHTKFGVSAIPITLALCLHLVQKDYGLSKEYPGPFEAWGRFVLALAPIVGWLTALMARGQDEAISDILVALLAGNVLYAVFREELPQREKTRFPAFVLGVVVFLAVVLIAGLP